MKNKVFYMSMLLMCIMTSCGDDNAPPTPDPVSYTHLTLPTT